MSKPHTQRTPGAGQLDGFAARTSEATRVVHASAAPRRERPSWLLPVATAALTAVILVADHVTGLEITVAVLYVTVVLLAARFLQARGIWLVAAGCAALTVLNAVTLPVVDTRALVTGTTNSVLSILAILLTAVLVVRGQAVDNTLHETQESLQQAEANLARLQRVMLVGEMTASIAHEINQPLTGVVANAGTALRWLSAQPPNLEEVRHYLGLIQSDGRRASEVIGRIRGLFRRVPPSLGPVDLNETVAEVCALVSSDLQRHAVLLRTVLAPDRPVVLADRVQLQQVILNLVVNAAEAMQDVTDRPRELELLTGRVDASQVFVEVRDSGPGLDPSRPEAVFDAFYTTKPGGMGMGLSISRSIVEAHSGHLSAAPNQPHGASFRLTLPITAEAAHSDADGTTAHGLHRR